jgi:hypothetical protein
MPRLARKLTKNADTSQSSARERLLERKLREACPWTHDAGWMGDAPGDDQRRGRDGGEAGGHTLGESSRMKGRVNPQGCPGSWSRPW